MSAIRYYNHHKDRLFEQYSRVDPTVIHAEWAEVHLKDREPGLACDIGAGSGRDANWLAEKGWRVVAVEPSELRSKAELTSHDSVTWLEDSLPDLRRLREHGYQFDLILLNAVWMHIRENQRERVIRILCDLLKPSGLLVVSLRLGTSSSEAQEQEFYPVSPQELESFANSRAISLEGHYQTLDSERDHLAWSWQVFVMPDDGTGNLPLLRHIIVNDDKTASYKLGLLRVLTRLAEEKPGLATHRDEWVDIPFGAVGLYWLKLYYPLLQQYELPQLPGQINPGFATDTFKQLDQVSIENLGLGMPITSSGANMLRQAIFEACKSIENNPAHFITYPGSSDKRVFLTERKSVKKHTSSITLSKEYLSQFGTLRMPTPLWQTLGQFACWLDPAIVREWARLTERWLANKPTNQSADLFNALAWSEPIRDTKPVIARALDLQEQGFPLSCIWSAASLRADRNMEIDHCFPWSRWPNNDLWNLLPSKKSINSNKGNKLPSSSMLNDAKGRMTSWWQTAWIESTMKEQFYMEAVYSLPGLESDQPSLVEIHGAAKHQQLRLHEHQQIPEWINPSLKESIKNQETI